MALSIDLGPGVRRFRTVDMHTTGEPTRIIHSGFPDVQGTLLEQRAEAMAKYDHVRKALLLEPRGHREMYGAVLRQCTELTTGGDAHMGVLFMTNAGFSTMCGHATIALGRFLVDCHDPVIFPRRKDLVFDASSKTVKVHLHCPSGLLVLEVPAYENGSKADGSRPVSFLSVPSFAVGLDLEILIPEEYRWPQMAPSGKVIIDLSYGGTFYCLVSATQLGFPNGFEALSEQLPLLNYATRQLKAAIQADENLCQLIRHPQYDDLSFLYSVIVVDDSEPLHASASSGNETGLCFFGDQQIDRSPTGGGVMARVALAHAKGKRDVGQKWVYNSVVSRAFGGGGFVGIVETSGTPIQDRFERQLKAVTVRVEGSACYTGIHEFIIEDSDPLKDGFLLDRLPMAQPV